MSERCNISPRFSRKFFDCCNISRTFGFYNSLIKYGGDTAMAWLFENGTSAIVLSLNPDNAIAEDRPAEIHALQAENPLDKRGLFIKTD